MGELGWLLFYTFIVLGSASVIWFYQIRRKMIMRMRAVVGALEEELQPRDKTYTLLGYLVGFRAEYRLPHPWAPRAWALYTMPPSHVLLYLPVIALMRERDRLEVTLQTRSPLPGEAHIYDPSDRASRRLVAKDTAGREERLRRGVIELAGRTYVALYSGDIALEKARALLERLTGLGVDVKRVTLVDDKRAVHVAVTPSLATLRPMLRELLRYTRRLAGS